MRNKYSQTRGKVRLSLNLDNLVLMSKARPMTLRKVKYYRLGDKSMSEAKICADRKLASWKTRSFKSPWVHEARFPAREKNIEYALKKNIQNFYNVPKTEFTLLLEKAKFNKVSIISIMESRADVLLCRAYLALSIFEARELIKQGAVMIDKRVISFHNEIVPIGSQLKINSIDAARSIFKIQTQFYNSRIKLTTPDHILFNGLNSLILKSQPQLNNIPFPKHIPVKKLAGSI